MGDRMTNFPLALSPSTPKGASLANLLAQGQLVIAPGVYDCITARLAETAGHQAAYMTGSGVSMSRLGVPDLGLLSFAEMADQAKRIADVTSLPIIADADTGYGGPLNVARTVREYEHAGIAAIQIEDQEWPKKCGHEPDRRIVSIQEMVGRIQAAVDAKHHAQTLIIARTDARTAHGIDQAIERAHRYAEAGADVIFVESPENEAEMRLVCTSLTKPCLANQVEGGRTPMLPAATLQEMGYRLAIYPNSITRLVGLQGARFMKGILEHGGTHAFKADMLNHRDLWDLFDYPGFVAAEQRYQSKN
jgi:2-methylisocitrate lyase-like PEP mutase family enzyme